MMRTKSQNKLLFALIAVCSTMFCAGLVMAESVFDESDDKGYDLPDFTKTYGFDVRPDVNLLKNRKNEDRMTKWKRKLKQSSEGKTDGGMKMGVQKYTKHSGERKYGLGLRRELTEKETAGVTVHGHGLSYDIKNKKSKRDYFLGIDSRTPIDKADDDGAYMYFGIKANW